MLDCIASAESVGQTLITRTRTTSLSLFVVLGTALFPIDAFAYLDPGTGSLIVQSIIAGLAAVGYGLRVYWGRIRTLLKRSNDSADPHSG